MHRTRHPAFSLGSAGHFKVSKYSLVAPAGALYLGPTHLAVATSRGPQNVTNFEAAPLLAASKIWHVFEISSGSCKLRTGQKASEGKNLCSHHGPVKWAIYRYIYICLYLLLCLGCCIHTFVYLSSIYLSKKCYMDALFIDALSPCVPSLGTSGFCQIPHHISWVKKAPGATIQAPNLHAQWYNTHQCWSVQQNPQLCKFLLTHWKKTKAQTVSSV